VIGQLHALAALPLEQNPGTYRTGGWVAHMAGLDDMETGNYLVRAEIRTPVGEARSLVIPTTLYRLMNVEDVHRHSFTPLSRT
jgi:hypothetical protein